MNQYDLTYATASGTYQRLLQTNGVYVYDGLNYRTIMSNQPVNTTGNYQTTSVPIMKYQIFPNGTGYCNIKVKNIGANTLSCIAFAFS